MLIKMKNPIKIFLVISVFVFFAGIAFSQDLIELQVIADSDTTSIYFGTDADGTDGLDAGLDAILPPSPPGFTGIVPYFLIEDTNFPKLTKDIRAVSNLSNVWKLLFEGSGSGTINWKASDIPVGENYTLAGIDMHNNDKYSFNASETIVISYSTSSSLIFNLNVSGGGDVIVLTYGMSDEATDNFDSGIDKPSPPAVPGDNFNAYLASTGILSSLEKDIRSDSGLTKEWIVKAEGELSGEVSWDNALFPTLGKFTIGDINMRDKDSCSIDANSTLILKYQKPGIPLTLVSSAGDTVKVTFGISYDATDGYDENIDFIGPPAAPNKIDAYFSNTDPAPYNHLSTDMRGVSSNLLSWALVTSNAAGTVYWDSADLPADGNFRLKGIDMRVAGEYSFAEGASIDITYNAENYNLNDLIFVSSENDTIILTFGTCVDASDEFDAGIDAISPPAPPEGFYACFISAQSTPYDKLSTDVRDVGNSYDKWNIATFRLGGTIHWNAEAITGGTYRLGNVYLNEASSYTFVASEALVLERFDNAAPYFVDTMPDTTIGEGEALSYTYTVDDPEGDEITFSLIDPPEGAAIDGTSGAFTWTPTYEQAGTYDIVVSVTDGIAIVKDTSVVTITDAAKPMDIATARADADEDFVPDLMGELVKVTGIVTTPNFSSGTDYCIQDENAGITVYSYGINVVLTEGDEVEVIGTVSQYKGKTEVEISSADDVTVLSSGNDLPAPIVITSLEAVDLEAGESMLVKFQVVELVDPDSWPEAGNEANLELFFGEDTIVMRIDKDTDLDGWADHPVMWMSFDVVGVIDQYTSSIPADDGYQLKPRAISDISNMVAIDDSGLEIPEVYSLNQNYPNPFNPSTTIGYALPFDSNVKLSIYNILGEKVVELVNEKQNAGFYNAIWGAGKMSSGVYFYSIEVKSVDGNNAFNKVKKMILVK